MGGLFVVLPSTYRLTIAGIERELPVVEVAPGLAIASFVILGDAELVEKTAPELVRRLPSVQYLVSAEAKGIPLAQEMSRLLGLKRYVVARKSVKPYMVNPLVTEVVSITTQKKQTLCFDGKDAALIKGKRVAIVDDVISTGASLEAVEHLVTAAGGIVAARAAILAEGKAADRDDIIFLEKLPIFTYDDRP
jgi:adenine phosphoribosyltransferase